MGSYNGVFTSTYGTPAATSDSALPSAGELYKDVQKQIQGYGNSEQAALQQSYQNAMGMGMQGLVSSGLAGTSVAASMRMGYMKQYQLALNNLNQQMTQQKLGAESTFGLGGLGLQQSQQQLNQQMALGQQQVGVSQMNATTNQNAQQAQTSLGQQQMGYNYARLASANNAAPQGGYGDLLSQYSAG